MALKVFELRSASTPSRYRIKLWLYRSFPLLISGEHWDPQTGAPVLKEQKRFSLFGFLPEIWPGKQDHLKTEMDSVNLHVFPERKHFHTLCASFIHCAVHELLASKMFHRTEAPRESVWSYHRTSSSFFFELPPATQVDLKRF